MAECNLLRDDFKNNVFAVSFDFYTPRPHFMILPKNIESIDPEFSRMTNDQTRQLIEVGISALASFRIRHTWWHFIYTSRLMEGQEIEK
jgi:hypothetical protein